MTDCSIYNQSAPATTAGGVTMNTVEEAIAELQMGRCIMVVDDPDRENEGDIICAAEYATTANVNLMATEAHGLICMPMSKAIAARLDFQPMVANNTDNHETAFTVSVDHNETTTGISAEERGLTARKVVDDASKPEDFRRPGHMFPSSRVPAAFWSATATPRPPSTFCGMPG